MLFGIDGMRVRAQAEIVDEWWLKIETAPDVVGCTGCGTRAVGHGRRRVKVRDLPVFGRPVVLVWAKRIWRCPDPDCATKTWTEQHPAIGPRQALTERARFEICRLVGADGWSVARAARAFGVGWHCAWAAVVDHGTPLINDPARTTGVSSLGVDETRFLARKRNRATAYVTGLVDLDRRPLLDVAIGRSGKVVTDSLGAPPPASPAALTPRGGSTGPTSCASPTRPSMTCAAAPNRRPSGIVAARATRSTGSAGCCSWPARTSTKRAGLDCSVASTLATAGARSAPPCWPRSSCGPCSALATSTTPADA